MAQYTHTHTNPVHAYTLFKVKAQGENVKWPSWDIKYFPAHHHQQTTCLQETVAEDDETETTGLYESSA